MPLLLSHRTDFEACGEAQRKSDDGRGRKVSTILAEAMLANRCPIRLVLETPNESNAVFVETLRTTTRLEHVTVVSYSRTATNACYEEMLDALGKNHGI